MEKMGIWRNKDVVVNSLIENISCITSYSIKIGWLQAAVIRKGNLDNQDRIASIVRCVGT